MQWNSKFFLTVEFKEKVNSGSLKPNVTFCGAIRNNFFLILVKLSFLLTFHS